ncbi:hypothetical protein RFI_11960, partial [Reticulomyxa filosa]
MTNKNTNNNQDDVEMKKGDTEPVTTAVVESDTNWTMFRLGNGQYQYQLTKPLHTWSVKDVVQWCGVVLQGVFKPFAKAFERHEINGVKLIEITREQLVKQIKMSKPKLRQWFFDEVRALNTRKPVSIRRDVEIAHSLPESCSLPLQTEYVGNQIQASTSAPEISVPVVHNVRPTVKKKKNDLQKKKKKGEKRRKKAFSITLTIFVIPAKRRSFIDEATSLSKEYEDGKDAKKSNSHNKSGSNISGNDNKGDEERNKKRTKQHERVHSEMTNSDVERVAKKIMEGMQRQSFVYRGGNGDTTQQPLFAATSLFFFFLSLKKKNIKNKLNLWHFVKFVPRLSKVTVAFPSKNPLFSSHGSLPSLPKPKRKTRPLLVHTLSLPERHSNGDYVSLRGPIVLVKPQSTPREQGPHPDLFWKQTNNKGKSTVPTPLVDAVKVQKDPTDEKSQVLSMSQSAKETNEKSSLQGYRIIINEASHPRTSDQHKKNLPSLLLSQIEAKETQMVEKMDSLSPSSSEHEEYKIITKAGSELEDELELEQDDDEEEENDDEENGNDNTIMTVMMMMKATLMVCGHAIAKLALYRRQRNHPMSHSTKPHTKMSQSIWVFFVLC